MNSNGREDMSMETNTNSHREPAAFGRLLVRSVLLGAFVQCYARRVLGRKTRSSYIRTGALLSSLRS